MYVPATDGCSTRCEAKLPDPNADVHIRPCEERSHHGHVDKNMQGQQRHICQLQLQRRENTQCKRVQYKYDCEHTLGDR